MLGTATTIDTRRTLLLNFRATPAEKQRIADAAAWVGESLSELVRRAALEASARTLAGTVDTARG